MFFSEKYDNMNENEREDLLKVLFMNSDSDYSAEIRTEYYSKQLKSMGENVKIGSGVKIINPQYVSIGDNVTIMDDVTIYARGEGGIEIGDNSRLCQRVYLDTQSETTGYIKIGSQVYIGTGTTLFGHMGLEIGDYSLLAQNITLTPYSHKFNNADEVIKKQCGNMKKVVIGRDCYIGMGACIMYSGDIGDGSVVGAASTVVKPIPPYSIAVGTPAKVIKSRKK